MTALTRNLSTFVMALFLGLGSSSAMATNYYWHSPTVLDKLLDTDGAQALVAAALVVDEAQVLDFSIAELLGNRRAEIVLFAPSNAAFENLLGLDEGSLNGLEVGQIKDALLGTDTMPSVLPTGVGAEQVAAILLRHVALPRRANLRTASTNALLNKGAITVAGAPDEPFPVSIGADGVQINYEATIIKGNIAARNGVIHFIDTVIVDGLL